MARYIFEQCGSAVLLNGSRELNFYFSSGGARHLAHLQLNPTDLCFAKTEYSLILARLKKCTWFAVMTFHAVLSNEYMTAY